MAKFAKSKEKPTKSELLPEELLLQETLKHLRRVLDSLDSSEDPASTAKESARLATAISSVTGELRARDKARVKTAELLDPGLVILWLRTRPQDELHAIFREVTGMDDEDQPSVLS